MAKWALNFTSEAERDLAQLDRETRRRIIDKIDWLAENFDSILPSVLTAELKEFFKLRVGDWRVMYSISWQSYEIKICYIDHRSKVYKKKK